MKNKILRLLMCIPFLGSRFSNFLYKCMGVHLGENARISPRINIVGDPSNLYLERNAEINYGVFILSKAPISLGENSTLAYGVHVITSANPNGPYNKLSSLYPNISKPINIGDNVWVGANAMLLPGVTIGDFSVVAAGAVVTKDIPSGVLVGGVPAKVLKKLQ